jgi:hypothetical protein
LVAVSRTVDASWAIESLCEQARRRLRSDDLGPFDFLEALQVLADSLRSEGRLSPPDQAVVRSAFVNSLVVQGMVRRQLTEYPEIARLSIDRPVFIIGLMRTGTTLLHNLVAQHHEAYCPRLWELISPVGGRHPAAQEQAKKTAKDFVNDLYLNAPRLPGIHFMDADRPDECHRLLANTFESRIFWLRYRVPGYAEWLTEQDLTAAYDYHRLQLQCLRWRIPAGIPVLKCPFHVWSLDSLLRVYPNARFVYLHRDPKTVVASSASLCAELRGARSPTVDKSEIGRFWLDQVGQVLDDWKRFVARHLTDRPVLHIRYPDLIRDPIGTARSVCEFAGMPMTSTAESRMHGYLRANPQGRHGRHEYRVEEYDLAAPDVDDRFSYYRSEYEFCEQ